MRWLGWIVVLFAFIEGGWLAYDGGYVLVTGEYVTPHTGEFAGQLGPWSKLVSRVGIDPRSTLMKSIHLVLGLGLGGDDRMFHLPCAVGMAGHALMCGGRPLVSPVRHAAERDPDRVALAATPPRVGIDPTVVAWLSRRRLVEAHDSSALPGSSCTVNPARLE